MTKTYQLSSEGIGFLGRQFLDPQWVLICPLFFCFFLDCHRPNSSFDGAQTQILGLVLCTFYFGCIMDTTWHNMLPHVHYKLKAMYNKTQFLFVWAALRFVGQVGSHGNKRREAECSSVLLQYIRTHYLIYRPAQT
jgi:hypothetical protein